MITREGCLIVLVLMVIGWGLVFLALWQATEIF